MRSKNENSVAADKKENPHFPRSRNTGPERGPTFAPPESDKMAFEKELIMKERAERFTAKLKYIAGVQGVDGGHVPGLHLY